MANVYIGKDGTRYVGSMADRKRAEDNKKKSTTSTTTSTTTTNKPSGSVASSVSRDTPTNTPSNYSQYTAPTLGNTYNANTDYQAIINNAVKNGDYVTAAKAEQLRKAKLGV